MSNIERTPNDPTQVQAELLKAMTYEVVPLKNLTEQSTFIPAGATVSVTCSPVKGVDTTVELAEALVGNGHPTIPHIAARMVNSEAHLGEIVDRCLAVGIERVFVIAGDGDEPLGPFADSLGVIEWLLTHRPQIAEIGFASYPDGHALIAPDLIRAALHRKQAMILDAGRTGWTSTQMCFDPDTIHDFLHAERDAGFELPVHLGVAGAVSPKKLLSMGMRLGIGQSLRFLKKNRSMTRLVVGGAYDANELIEPLSVAAAELGVTGIHCFTFNQIEATAAWQDASLVALGS